MNELHPFCPYGQKGLDDVLTGICSLISPYTSNSRKPRLPCMSGSRKHPGMFCSEPVSDDLRTLSNIALSYIAIADMS